MSYHVNYETLLFDDLDKEDALKLGELCREIVLYGKVDMQHESFVRWIEAAGYDERQALLVYATAFPQRALLSIADYWINKYIVEINNNGKLK